MVQSWSPSAGFLDTSTERKVQAEPEFTEGITYPLWSWNTLGPPGGVGVHLLGGREDQGFPLGLVARPQLNRSKWTCGCFTVVLWFVLTSVSVWSDTFLDLTLKPETFSYSSLCSVSALDNS